MMRFTPVPGRGVCHRAALLSPQRSLVGVSAAGKTGDGKQGGLKRKSGGGLSICGVDNAGLERLALFGNVKVPVTLAEKVWAYVDGMD